MAEETDGIEEAFEGQLRVLVTAAGQIGERVARAREEALRGEEICLEDPNGIFTCKLIPSA